MSSLSVFFPAHNDAHSIGPLVERAFEVLAEVCPDHEVIVVNDGSRDETAEVLDKLHARYPALKVVTHAANRGYGGALISGFATASKQWVFYTDGDGQYDVGELKLLLEKLTPDIDMVNGYKKKRSDPWYRILIGRVYRKTMKIAFGLKIKDIDCDFRIIRRSFFERMTLTNTSGVICIELVKKLQLLGCRSAEVGVTHLPRLSGTSQFFRLPHLTRTLLSLWPLWKELVLTRPRKVERLRYST